MNLAAPNPLPNAEFMADLRAAAGIRWGLPAPAWMLEIGAFFMRTETELILKSRRVIPGRLLESGFKDSIFLVARSGGGYFTAVAGGRTEK